MISVSCSGLLQRGGWLSQSSNPGLSQEKVLPTQLKHQHAATKRHIYAPRSKATRDDGMICRDFVTSYFKLCIKKIVYTLWLDHKGWKYQYKCILICWKPRWKLVLLPPALSQPLISEDAIITHQSKWGWFIYPVNTRALLITLHITLKEFHLHQSHDCSIENDFFLFSSLARTGLKAG